VRNLRRGQGASAKDNQQRRNQQRARAGRHRPPPSVLARLFWHSFGGAA